MKAQDLIRMANQIADYYRAYPKEEAELGVATHIKSFWDPRMRAGLTDIVKGGGNGLNDLALAGALRVVKPDMV